MRSLRNKKTRSSLRHLRTYAGHKKPKVRYPEDTRFEDAIGPVGIAFGSLLLAAVFPKAYYVGLPLLAAGIHKKQSHLTIAGTIMSTYNMLFDSATFMRDPKQKLFGE